jgi:hypothetical protein
MKSVPEELVSPLFVNQTKIFCGTVTFPRPITIGNALALDFFWTQPTSMEFRPCSSVWIKSVSAFGFVFRLHSLICPNVRSALAGPCLVTVVVGFDSVAPFFINLKNTLGRRNAGT